MLVVASGVLLSTACSRETSSGGPAADDSIEHAILVAEDGRIATEADLERLIDGLEHESPDVQRRAVRAVGRLEQPGLHILVQPLLQSADPEVRAEAVSAFAQVAIGIARPRRAGPIVDVTTFSDRLLALLAEETDPDVVGVICESLGHLPYRTAAQVTAVEAAIVAAATAAEGPTEVSVMLGASKGLESLLRLQGALMRPSARTRELLRDWVTSPVEAEPESGTRADRLSGFFADAPVRIRRLALAALGAAGAVEPSTLEVAVADPDPQVRRLGVAGVAATEMGEAGRRLLQQAVQDDEPMVRVAAVRAIGQSMSADSCALLLAAADDESAHVALQAIDRLGACDADARQALTDLVDTWPASSTEAGLDWHRPTRALLALARVSKDDAADRLASFSSHPVWQVRMYAARAASMLGDRQSLERLASDDHDNVREAALRGLADVAGHEADPRLRAALEAEDYQLVRTAALALEGTPDRPEASVALLDALDRLTAQRRDTSRDPRTAILDRLATVGSSADADRIRPYVRDFDLQVAGRAAALLKAWVGGEPEPEPQPLEAPAVPGRDELDTWASGTARFTMARGGTFVVRLLTDEAPVTVMRFVRLARAGYYDGLTFHRVVPNFVIQGGSPGANEFMGDGPYMRDEVGLRPHVRGAVGISTRGRDTGDGQVFVDLIDSPRLDHNYTVFGQVVGDMDVVDAVLEGDVIETIEIR